MNEFEVKFNQFKAKMEAELKALELRISSALPANWGSQVGQEVKKTRDAFVTHLFALAHDLPADTVGMGRTIHDGVTGKLTPSEAVKESFLSSAPEVPSAGVPGGAASAAASASVGAGSSSEDAGTEEDAGQDSNARE